MLYASGSIKWARGAKHPERIRPYYAYPLFHCSECLAKTDNIVSDEFCDRCWLRKRCR